MGFKAEEPKFPTRKWKWMQKEENRLTTTDWEPLIWREQAGVVARKPPPIVHHTRGILKVFIGGLQRCI